MWGQCRRTSPHLNPLSAKSYLVEGVWPMVRDDDWCGEWRASTRVSMSRVRLAPVADNVAAVATAANSAPVDRPVAAISAVAGDD